MRSGVLFCCEISKNVNSNSAEKKYIPGIQKGFSPLTERSGPISPSGVVETCCWKRCSGCTTRPGGHTGFPEWYIWVSWSLGIHQTQFCFNDFGVVGRYVYTWLASHASLTRFFMERHHYFETPTRHNFSKQYATWSVCDHWFLWLHLTTKGVILSVVFFLWIQPTITHSELRWLSWRMWWDS